MYNAPMKILITSPSLNSDLKISGISSVVQFIIESNRSQEYVHFELGRKDDEKRNAAWLLRMIRTYFSWLKIMSARQNILVHFNMALCRFSIIRDFPLILTARIFRKKMVIHLHGGDYLMQKNPPAWMQLLWKMSFSGRYPVIVLSPCEEEILKRRIEKKRIFTLPNCINLKDSYEFERNYLNDRTVTLLFLGRISIDKGLEFIYRALRSLRKRNIKFRFVMAGRGPDEEQYSARFSELLGKDFEFTGVVSGNQKTEVFKRCNVFLLPSFYEGLPMALLESMSFGLVPVTTDVGSIGQVISDDINGKFVRSHSSTDIENAIETLVNDGKYRHKLSRNARLFIFNNFDPDLYVKKLNEIYTYE
jgi:glycosyltransferase involved in cell wall biosynthesis